MYSCLKKPILYKNILSIKVHLCSDTFINYYYMDLVYKYSRFNWHNIEYLN